MTDIRPPYPISTFQYGPSADQVGDLHLPDAPRPPVVCLLHGGFWRMPYGRDQLKEIARDLATRGFAAWNLEYRRLGAPGGGWPGTLQDVAAGINHLARLAGSGIELDLKRVAVVGHSAGGQLALWSAARERPHDLDLPASQVRVRAAIGLAPVADLHFAYDHQVGDGVVAELLGGSPARYPDRYQAASPIAMLPLGVPQRILHGTLDEVVPLTISRRYVAAAKVTGDSIELVELAGAGHMEYLDPGSQAHRLLCQWLSTFLGGKTGSGNLRLADE